MNRILTLLIIALIPCAANAQTVTLEKFLSAPFPSEGAGLYLRGRNDVDDKRIGIWGGSYGGYLTAMDLSRASDLFAAGVDIHGVHDWNTGIKNFVPSYNPLDDPKAAKLAFDSSPLASVDGWRSPALMTHGDDDRNGELQ